MIGPIRTILIRSPNWVGDCVMATPALAAFRDAFRDATILLLAPSYTAEVFEGGDWFDELLVVPGSRSLGAFLRAVQTAAALRRRRADLGILMTNSLGSAVLMKLAGARNIVGYSRNGRSALLTTALAPARTLGGFVPGPMVDYYLELARAVRRRTDGTEDRRIRLATTPREEEAARTLWERLGLGSRRVAGLNPGAAFGSAKCWPPAHFAALGRMLAERSGLDVLVLCGPAERSVARAIITEAGHPAVRGLEGEDVPLGVLKAVVRRLALLVTNDSGPRHFACAFAVPTVTVFGPTDERWSETARTDEIKIVRDLACRPCMRRVCPTDHACMRSIEPEAVYEAATELLKGHR
ncbi:MAG: lipopolysaccharide heptosyltransferase II [Planctomycetota bacterium]